MPLGEHHNPLFVPHPWCRFFKQPLFYHVMIAFWCISWYISSYCSDCYWNLSFRFLTFWPVTSTITILGEHIAWNNHVQTHTLVKDIAINISIYALGYVWTCLPNDKTYAAIHFFMFISGISMYSLYSRFHISNKRFHKVNIYVEFFAVLILILVLLLFGTWFSNFKELKSGESGFEFIMVFDIFLKGARTVSGFYFLFCIDHLKNMSFEETVEFLNRFTEENMSTMAPSMNPFDEEESSSEDYDEVYDDGIQIGESHSSESGDFYDQDDVYKCHQGILSQYLSRSANITDANSCSVHFEC